MKKHVFTIVSALALAAASTAKELTFECSVGTHTITVQLVDQPFRRDAHEIEFRKGGFGKKTLHIDGKEPIGTDNLLPHREWKRFSVSWDGKEVPVAPEFYRNHYNPNLDTEVDPQSGHASLRFIVDPKGQWIQILMFGSDGAGSYLVAWHLSRDGKHKLIDPVVFTFSD